VEAVQASGAEWWSDVIPGVCQIAAKRLEITTQAFRPVCAPGITLLHHSITPYSITPYVYADGRFRSLPETKLIK
jgi:hypothetical protein